MTPIITFYSVKGGVGRTQALANVGAQMCSRGFRVLLVDFDLEAPGLTWLSRTPNTPGVVELLLDAKNQGSASDLFKMDAGSLLTEYSYEVDAPEGLTHAEGSLRVMPAGRQGEGYGDHVHQLGLGALYTAGTGHGLIAVFKERLQSADVDFVLVDSRTGFSDEGGICTRDLADGVVVVLGLNRQNREGTAQFLQNLKAHGPKQLTLVLSPVPNGEDEEVDAAEQMLCRRLSEAWGQRLTVAVRIGYHSRLALTEELRFWPRGHALGDAYRHLFNHVVALAGLHPESLIRTLFAAAKRGDVVDSVEAVKAVARVAPERLEGVTMADDVQKLLLAKGSDPLHEALLARLDGESWVVTSTGKDLYDQQDDRAGRWLQHALDADPSDADCMGNYALFVRNIRGDHAAAKVLFQQAVQASPDSAQHLGNFAAFLRYDRADYDAAESYFCRAIEVDPLHAQNLGNYANFLADCRGDHERANVMFVRAINADPDDSTCLGNYARFLADQGNDHDAAENIFRISIQVGPENAGCLGNFAHFLWVIRNDLKASERLFERAIEADPVDVSTLGNYAQLLLVLGRTNEARDLIRRAWLNKPEPTLQLELRFYAWAHQLDNDAWPPLLQLLQDGVRSPRWPLDETVRVAIEQGHPDPDRLKAVAEVISKGAALDGIPDLRSS